MAQSFGSDSDELINEFLGKTTGYTFYPHNFDEFSYLDLNTPHEQMPIEFDYPFQHISQPFTAQGLKEDPFLSANSNASFIQDTYKDSEIEKSQATGNQEDRACAVRRKEKNSNAIKKIGRIILDNLREYRKVGANAPICSMLKMLSKNSKVGRTEVNKRDKFNTYHLRALFSGKDNQIVHHNLKTTRLLLSRHLRQNVMDSRQISDDNKALYLNTMKCSVLRCSNRALAVRLQMAAEQ